MGTMRGNLDDTSGGKYIRSKLYLQENSSRKTSRQFCIILHRRIFLQIIIDNLRLHRRQ